MHVSGLVRLAAQRRMTGLAATGSAHRRSNLDPETDRPTTTTVHLAKAARQGSDAGPQAQIAMCVGVLDIAGVRG
jgi:hypothetical protein